MFSSFLNFGTVVSQRYGEKQLFLKSFSEQKVLERGIRRRLFSMWGGGGGGGANNSGSQKPWPYWKGKCRLWAKKFCVGSELLRKQRKTFIFVV
jgi:hypothetical protein